MPSTPPAPYTPQNNYQTIAAAHPANYVPGSQMDVDYAAIASCLSDIITRAGLIQRDDGQIINGGVGFAQLSMELVAAINQQTGVLYVGTYTLATLPAASSLNAGSLAVISSGLGSVNGSGGYCMVLSNGVEWGRVSAGGSTTRQTTGGSLSLSSLVDAPIQLLTGTLATNLVITISTAGSSRNRSMFRIVDSGVTRSGHTVSVNGKTITAGQWIEYIFDGNTSAWVQCAGGTLL